MISKAGSTLPGISLSALLLLSTGAAAGRRDPPNLDVRTGSPVSERQATLAANPSAAVNALTASLGSRGIVALDGLTGTPRMVGRLDGFLTGPSSAPAARVALDYVRAHAAVFQVDAGSLELAREYVSVDGTHHLWWRQVVNGIPVFGNGLKANVAEDGSLINVSGSPLAVLSGAAAVPLLTADDALAQTRRDVGASVVPVPSTLRGDARMTTDFATGERAALSVIATPKGNRLAWDLFVEPSDTEMYRHVVDARTGEILFRQSLVNSHSPDTSFALAFRNYPGADRGGKQELFNLTGNGWLPPRSRLLSGPNAHVYSDVNANNIADAPEEIGVRKDHDWVWELQRFTPPVAGCDLFICTWDPAVPFSWTRNRNQSGTQLFVLINTFHDHLRAGPIGFTPAAGNFEGDDPVRGEAMDGANTKAGLPDGAHIDNANFGTPPDGFSPRMQMFLWHFPDDPTDPFIAADGANDAGIVYHEYTHGLSNRLVVDADGFSTLGNIQAGSMGEAWSDWYAYDFLEKQGLQVDAPGVADVRVGNYVAGGQDLIRFEPIDCKVGQLAGCPGGVLTGPGGFTYADFGRVAGGPEVHADGEIWVQTLWDLRDSLGSDLTEGLVTRAMELSPFNPSFLDERNAILQADLVLTGGANEDTIWSVFAHRGMGFFSGTLDGDDTRPVADFRTPPPPNAPKGDLSGLVSDLDTGGPIQGAIVAFGGHDHGAGNYVATSAVNGSYSIFGIFAGTYPKVSARGPGFDPIVLNTLSILPGANRRDFQLRRDFASAAGGGLIAAFNGPDFTSFGCGPINAIDQSQGAGWGSDTDVNEQSTGLASDKFIVVRLPTKVNVSEIKVNPANNCGDPGSSSTRGFRIDISADGTTFTTLTDGVFYLRNRGVMNSVFLGSAPNIQFVRFWILNPQVPSNPAANACTGPADCGTAPDDDSGVALHCGPGKDNGFGGCTFMDMVELAVYGRPAP